MERMKYEVCDGWVSRIMVERGKDKICDEKTADIIAGKGRIL